MPRQTNIQIRRGTASDWASVNPTLASGEIAMETDTRKIKVGDGSTAWNSLQYVRADGGDLEAGGSPSPTATPIAPTPTATPTPPNSSLAVSATYGYRTLVGAFNVSADSVSGNGTAANPLVVVLGGSDDQDNRVWIEVQQSGTLNFSVTASSEYDYDGGRLYITSSSPAQHTSYTIIKGNDPAGYTPLSSWRDGVNKGSSDGTASVTAGQYLVLLYTKDSSESDGTDTITATLYIA